MSQLTDEQMRKLGAEHGIGIQIVDGDDWSDKNFIWFDGAPTDFARAIYKIGQDDTQAKCESACLSAIDVGDDRDVVMWNKAVNYCHKAIRARKE